MIATILTAALVTCSAGNDNADLADSTIMLQEVSVSGQRQRDYQMRTSQSSIQVNREFLRENLAGSLMQTLEGLPGVKAMSIGSGQSKPTIRGLGFNQMAVVEDGVKHEGQQWGDDHGLEIDQFAIDRAEVIKGPAALLYGSDARQIRLPASCSCSEVRTTSSSACRPKWVDGRTVGFTELTRLSLIMPTTVYRQTVSNTTAIGFI